MEVRAAQMIARVEEDNLAEAAKLVLELRNAQQYPLMLRLAEAISRNRPEEPTTQYLYAQALSEQGHGTAAIDMLERLTARLKPGDPS